MDPAPPTTVPDRPTLPAEAPRRRSLLGIPTRLALFVLASVALFAAGIVAYADSQVQQSRMKYSGDVAITAVRDVGSLLIEDDLDAGDSERVERLQPRLEQAVEDNPELVGIVVYAPASKGGGVERLAHAGDASGSALANLATDSLESADDLARVSGNTVTAAWPVQFGADSPKGIVAASYRAEGLAEVVRRDRLELILGGVLGGALLAAIVLMLLRRELFRPFAEMRRVMSHIKSGAQGVRIGWNRGDELGLVADEFDAMVAQLEEAQAELATYVDTDALTGLLNREAFTDRFAAEFTRARREAYPITLVAIDIDDLDEINRTHDRAAGDQVLAAVGSVIDGCTRPTDACGRTGGDSFHVALVGAEVAQAAVVIERIRREIAQRVGIGPERTRITCGFGVAEYPKHAVDQIALERMANSACAYAQRDGRDRALAFGPSGGYVDAKSLLPDSGRVKEQTTGARELASTVHALARALDGIDPALGGSAHSQRVARYAAALAREYGYGDSEMNELRSAAVLHDIGKVAVPPAILRTPEEQLDERQRGALRYHAWVSRTMIAGAGLPGVADIVFHIPERWDGAGYPERRSEDAIPHASRILRAAELLDELTSSSITPAIDPIRAAGELKHRAGRDLDPDIAFRLAHLVRNEGLVGNVPAASSEDSLAA